ncbi:hypothetical protein AJ80_08711 [Polytolypa hystricis UAMH7299]|uniref:SAC3/GANP/THP3 conserved domain-containing protein n=1 Tax=Polytolypa hystricis (strain UAMH7299) TaxID=1447883 RepID=A0A2B7X3K2_POLH7|nr:hypothetical protein AJ80_08711 [Polytolypa hystricis UAMH7299]
MEATGVAARGAGRPYVRGRGRGGASASASRSTAGTNNATQGSITRGGRGGSSVIRGVRGRHVSQGNGQAGIGSNTSVKISSTGPSRGLGNRQSAGRGLHNGPATSSACRSASPFTGSQGTGTDRSVFGNAATAKFSKSKSASPFPNGNSTIDRSRDPRRRSAVKGATPLPTDYNSRYDQLKLDRAKLRTEAIKSGQMADPNQPTSLNRAITPTGTCTDMCPEFERVERVVQKMVDKCEKSIDPETGASETAEMKMLKRFRRSAAGYDEQLPSDIRTPKTLLQTMNYLLRHVIEDDETLRTIHKFVWDRTRSIRNDLSIQQLTQKQDVEVAVKCLERIARFHIISLHLLSSPENTEPFDHHQEREQLNNTFLSLLYFYDDNQGRVKFPNEDEFRAYYILFSIHDQRPDLEARVQKWPRELRQSPRVQVAMELFAAAGNTWEYQGTLDTRRSNAIAQGFYSRFFKIIRSSSVSYLMACVAEIYFNQVRQTAMRSIWKAYCRQPLSQQSKNQEWTIDDLTVALAFDNTDQTIEFCEEQDLNLATNGEDQLYLSWGERPLDSVGFQPSSLQTFSETYVESKRCGRTLVALVLGMNVAQAANHHMIKQAIVHFEPEGQLISAEDEGLFVSDDEGQSQFNSTTPQEAEPEQWGVGSSMFSLNPNSTMQPQPNLFTSGVFGTSSTKGPSISTNGQIQPPSPFTQTKPHPSMSAPAVTSGQPFGGPTFGTPSQSPFDTVKPSPSTTPTFSSTFAPSTGSTFSSTFASSFGAPSTLQPPTTQVSSPFKSTDSKSSPAFGQPGSTANATSSGQPSIFSPTTAFAPSPTTSTLSANPAFSFATAGEKPPSPFQAFGASTGTTTSTSPFSSNLGGAQPSIFEQGAASQSQPSAFTGQPNQEINSTFGSLSSGTARSIFSPSQPSSSLQSVVATQESSDAEAKKAQQAVAAKEAAEREAARREAERKEAERREAEKREAERQEIEKKKTAEREAAARAAAEAEVKRREMERREAAAREAAQRVLEQKRAAEREAARLEIARREAEELQAAQRDIARIEAAEREAAEREQARRESIELDIMKRKAAYLEADDRAALFRELPRHDSQEEFLAVEELLNIDRVKQPTPATKQSTSTTSAINEDEILFNAARLAASTLANGARLWDGVQSFSNSISPASSVHIVDQTPKGKGHSSSAKKAASHIIVNGYDVALAPPTRLGLGRTMSRTEQRIRQTGARGLASLPVPLSQKQQQQQPNGVRRHKRVKRSSE